MYDDRKEKPGFIRRVFRGVDATRKFILNVIFWVLVIVVITLMFKDGKPDVPESGALVLKPTGTIVEQVSADPMAKIQGQIMGTNVEQTLLKDLIDAVNSARDDERISVLALDLNAMGSAGLTKLQDLRAAIDSFKESGKPVIAFADTFDQNRYYLAASADEIYMHEMGMLILEGFGRYRTYYKEGLDKLKVDVHIFKVGTFKSAVEPYMRNNMSDAAKEANVEWMGDLWAHYLNDVAEARGISVDDLNGYIEQFPAALEAAKGDSAKVALDAGLVDHVVPRDKIRDRLIELAGEDEEKHTFKQIGFNAYLQALDEDRFGKGADENVVAVVVASGTILDGTQPPGNIGGDSTAALIRKARQDDNVKAIVLRVDSGGGSAFASEVIRRELELAREAGKPVISSMGTVAASGGYWITMASDEVWAAPTTITGSIGIFGMFPTYNRAMEEYLGMRVDGVGTTSFAGAMRPDRALQPEVGQLIQQMINKGYQDFISKVAAARKMTVEDVDKIAQGRVWSGEDAHKLGLVDSMGGLQDAIKAAAKRADLGEEYQVKYMEKEKNFKQKVMEKLGSGMVDMTGNAAVSANRLPVHTGLMRLLTEQAEKLAQLNDPNGVYAYFPYED